MSYAKDAKQLIRTIEHQPGIEIRQNGNGHYSVFKDDKLVTTISYSPSDHRWRDHAIADLRRAGITPSVKPQKAHVEPKKIMSRPDIVKRIRNDLPLGVSPFARWMVTDLPSVYPHDRDLREIRHLLDRIKNGRQNSMHFATQELLDAAFRTWDKVEAQKQAEPAGPVTPQSIDADKETREKEADAIIAEVFGPADIMEFITSLTQTMAKQQETLEKVAQALDHERFVAREADRGLADRLERLESRPEHKAKETPRPTAREAYIGALLQNVALGYINPEVLTRLDKLVGLGDA